MPGKGGDCYDRVSCRFYNFDNILATGSNVFCRVSLRETEGEIVAPLRNLNAATTSLESCSWTIFVEGLFADLNTVFVPQHDRAEYGLVFHDDSSPLSLRREQAVVIFSQQGCLQRLTNTAPTSHMSAVVVLCPAQTPYIFRILSVKAHLHLSALTLPKTVHSIAAVVFHRDPLDFPGAKLSASLYFTGAFDQLSHVSSQYIQLMTRCRMPLRISTGIPSLEAIGNRWETFKWTQQ